MLELLALMLLSQQPLQHVAQGLASYYTSTSSGTHTACGEKMNDEVYTCAMRKAPLGSYVLVVANNGRSVVCRVNDRGPYVKGRVVDLSEAAMRKLHAEADLLRVKVYKFGMDGVKSLLGLRAEG